MTRPPAPPPDPRPDPEFATAASVSGLAREVDGLRRTVQALQPISGRVEDLERLISQLIQTVDALTARPAAVATPSWLFLPSDTETAAVVLDELCGWLTAIYLRYTDGAVGLPECWLWHPDVVEELLWLMHAWLAAYQGTHASVALVGDWHDRYRPGVVRRIRQVAGTCSRENHQIRDGWTTTLTGAPVVPAVDAVESIAAWWAEHRDQPAPEPAPAAVAWPNGARYR